MAFTNARLDSVTAREVGNAVGVSERPLRRQFSAVTGLTWRQYLLESRLLHAMARLTEPGVTVLEVATSVGFESVSAFVYRGHGVGLMPSVYCNEKIANGDLVRLLPDWSSPEILIHAVYPTRRYMPSRLYVFLDALRAWSARYFTS